MDSGCRSIAIMRIRHSSTRFFCALSIGRDTNIEIGGWCERTEDEAGATRAAVDEIVATVDVMTAAVDGLAAAVWMVSAAMLASDVEATDCVFALHGRAGTGTD